MPRTAIRRFLSAAFLLAALPLWAAGFVSELSPRSSISIKLETDPPNVMLERDLMLTLTVESPAGQEIKLPDLRDRFSGFSKVEEFAGERLVAGERARQIFRWKLTPEAEKSWRLAPFAVSVIDTAAKREVDAFATAPVRFPPPPPRPPVTGEIEADPQPEWIPPTPRQVATWIFAALAGIALLFGAFRLLMSLSRRVKEARLSPAERAMVELERLLGKHLPERGLFKDFYVEITFVVRRYVERTYGIRAPSQTTEEFLQAIKDHPRFTRAVAASLAEFLNAADQIKFAGVEATPARAEEAVTRVRDYIAADSAAATPSSVRAPGN